MSHQEPSKLVQQKYAVQHMLPVAYVKQSSAQVSKERGASRRKVLLALLGLAATLTIICSATLMAGSGSWRAFRSTLTEVSYVLDEPARLAGVPPVTACRYCFTCFVDHGRVQQVVQLSPGAAANLRRMLLWEQQQQGMALRMRPWQQAWPSLVHYALQVLPTELSNATWQELWYLHLRGHQNFITNPSPLPASLGWPEAERIAARARTAAVRIPAPAALVQRSMQSADGRALLGAEPPGAGAEAPAATAASSVVSRERSQVLQPVAALQSVSLAPSDAAAEAVHSPPLTPADAAPSKAAAVRSVPLTPADAAPSAVAAVRSVPLTPADAAAAAAGAAGAAAATAAPGNVQPVPLTPEEAAWTGEGPPAIQEPARLPGAPSDATTSTAAEDVTGAAAFIVDEIEAAQTSTRRGGNADSGVPNAAAGRETGSSGSDIHNDSHGMQAGGTAHQRIVANDTQLAMPETDVTKQLDAKLQQLEVQPDAGKAGHESDMQQVVPSPQSPTFVWKWQMSPGAWKEFEQEQQRAQEERQKEKAGAATTQNATSAVVPAVTRRGAPDQATKQALLVDPRAAYPNCTRCTACSHELQPLGTERDLLGVKYQLGGVGASRAWIFNASTEYGEGGVAAAKVWCIPINKQGGLAPGCELGSMDKYVSKLKALDMLIDDCEVRNLYSRVWVERVRGLLPQYGYVVDSDGMFMDIARGVPVHQQTFATPGALLNKNIWPLWQRINGTRIVEAAVFDLLTAQCDRHAENVFVDETGRLTLIDNDQMLGESWRTCGADSIFLPTTQKYEINVHGYYWIMRAKWKNSRPKGYPNPQLLFDYRCHVPSRQLGTDYPPGLARCIAKLDGMSISEITDHYGFHGKQSAILKQRAADLLHQGFEWTLEHGKPQNPESLTYAWQPPCCNMTYVGEWSGLRDDWRCIDRWEPEVDGEGKQPWIPPPRSKEDAQQQAMELRNRQQAAAAANG